jgi:starch synthase (maltosyl-transferring)
VIAGVKPEVDCGRFPIKRIVGDMVEVEADIFTDGHDALAAVLRHRPAEESEWSEAHLEPLPNDRWRGHFHVTRIGIYVYAVNALNNIFMEDNDCDHWNNSKINFLTS